MPSASSSVASSSANAYALSGAAEMAVMYSSIALLPGGLKICPASRARRASSSNSSTLDGWLFDDLPFQCRSPARPRRSTCYHSRVRPGRRARRSRQTSRKPMPKNGNNCYCAGTEDFGVPVNRCIATTGRLRRCANRRRRLFFLRRLIPGNGLRNCLEDARHRFSEAACRRRKRPTGRHQFLPALRSCSL